MSSFSPTTFGIRWAKLATSSLGTAFHSDHSNGSRPKGAGKPFGSPPRETLVARWAYSTYDNVPASHDERGHAIDLYVASGLNARIGSDELGAIRAVALEAFEALAQVPATITFWALPRADLLDPPRGATLGLSTEPGD